MDLRLGAAGEADPRQGATGVTRMGRGREVYPRQGATSAARMGRGDEQAAWRGYLGQRREERAPFVSAEVRPFLLRYPNM